MCLLLCLKQGHTVRLGFCLKSLSFSIKVQSVNKSTLLIKQQQKLRPLALKGLSFALLQKHRPVTCTERQNAVNSDAQSTLWDAAG